MLAVPGGTPVPIHEPFATLITQLPARRTNGVADQIGSPWLFPGRHAGRPAGPLILASRLRTLGISPAAMRNTARAQLAAEIPPRHARRTHRGRRHHRQPLGRHRQRHLAHLRSDTAGPGLRAARAGWRVWLRLRRRWAVTRFVCGFKS